MRNLQIANLTCNSIEDFQIVVDRALNSAFIFQAITLDKRHLLSLCN